MFPVRAIHQIEMTSRCSQALIQMCLERILCAVWWLMPKRRAIRLEPMPSIRLISRISRTISAVSFFPRAGEVAPSKRCPSIAWRWLAARLHHSRLIGVLWVLSKSIWLTSALGVGGLPMKAVATKRCAFFVEVLFSLQRFTSKYPRLSGVCLRTRPCLSAVLYRFLTTWGRLRTLPKELTSYQPSYPSIARHSSVCMGEL